MTSTHTQMHKLLGAALLAVLAAGCSQKDIDINNPNVALASAVASDPTALQLLATGLLVDQRGTRAGFIQNTGIFGREAYNYTPQEGRNTTHYLIGINVAGKQELDPTGFAGGLTWGGEYGADRDIYNFKNTIAAAAGLSTAQKAASLGFAQTIEGLMLLEVVQFHDSLGGVTEVKANPFDLSPFVSRDSMYKYVLNTLDAAATNLAGGGSAFPFTLSAGFAGFNTPATFLLFNRAIKAKASANYATAGGGATAWAATLAALSASFLNAAATTRAQFDVGVYDTYAPAPDTPNGLTQATNTNLYAHPSFTTDAQTKADGTPDNRYLAKIRTGLPSRTGPTTGDGPTSGTSTIGFSIWPTTSSSIPIIRNEELILLRAEAKQATGDKAGAIADLNQVRVNSGGLPASTLTTASTDDAVITAILYEKRYSTMMEGNRWIDMRRYGKLNLLPLDISTGANKNFVPKVTPISQAECLVRAKLGATFLGPNGLNDCAP
ncbi:MAG: RagB/SusD family nutrient uptake outer membrane protein [Gemmatimonadaceae bacterium]